MSGKHGAAAAPSISMRRVGIVTGAVSGGYPLLGTSQCNDAFEPTVGNVCWCCINTANRPMMPSLSTLLGRVMVLNIRRYVDRSVRAAECDGWPADRALVHHMLPTRLRPATRGITP
jgi:hypothetical protein